MVWLTLHVVLKLNYYYYYYYYYYFLIRKFLLIITIYPTIIKMDKPNRSYRKDKADIIEDDT